MTENAQALWHGRFSVAPNDDLMSFTESLSFDQRLWKDDIFASIAHVKGLEHSKVLTSSEASTIVSALEQVASEFSKDQFKFVKTDEDIHTAIERRITEIAGEVGGKVHTGRRAFVMFSTRGQIKAAGETTPYIFLATPTCNARSQYSSLTISRHTRGLSLGISTDC